MPEHPFWVTVGARVRMSICDRLGSDRLYVFDGPGTVIRASADGRGGMGFSVQWDSGGITSIAQAGWLVPEDAPRDAEGCLIGEPPDYALANFLASVDRYGCVWSGDIREPAAWHAEQPEKSGWWEGGLPFFSLTVRKMMQAAANA